MRTGFFTDRYQTGQAHMAGRGRLDKMTSGFPSRVLLKGFNDDLFNWTNHAQDAANTGANCARITFGHDKVNTTEGNDAVAAVTSRGMTPILNIWSTTVLDPTYYAGRCAAAAATYPTSIIECINEPNIAPFGNWTTTQAGLAIAAAINACPPQRVVTSAVANIPEYNEPVVFGYQNAMHYVAAQNSDWSKVLGIGVHVYPIVADDPWAFMQRHLANAYIWQKPLYVTECGMQYGWWHDDWDDMTKQLVNRCQTDSRVMACCVHRLAPQNPTPNQTDTDQRSPATQFPSLAQNLTDAFSSKFVGLGWPNAKPGIIAAPGGNGQATDWQDDEINPGVRKVLRLAADGSRHFGLQGFRFVTLATDWTWGNDYIVGRLDDLYAYACAKHGFRSDKVHLLGYSAGAPGVLSWARVNTQKVASIALMVPTIDLQQIDTNDLGAEWGFQMPGTAWGLHWWDAPSPAPVPDHHNPADFAAELDGLPIKIWYSSNDDIALPATIEAFGAACGAELVPCGAQSEHVFPTLDIYPSGEAWPVSEPAAGFPTADDTFPTSTLTYPTQAAQFKHQLVSGFEPADVVAFFQNHS